MTIVACGDTSSRDLFSFHAIHDPREYTQLAQGSDRFADLADRPTDGYSASPHQLMYLQHDFNHFLVAFHRKVAK